MAYYGQLISDLGQDKNTIYTLFTNYYKNPTVKKIKNSSTHSIYMAKIHCLLATVNRFIILMTSLNDEPYNTSKSMADIQWEVFQARELKDIYRVSVHYYIPERGTEMDDKISRTYENYEIVSYKSEKLPLKITLLKVPNMPKNYNANGTLLSALETFNTIVTFN